MKAYPLRGMLHLIFFKEMINNKNCNFYLFGAGGHSKVIIDIAEGLGLNILGIIDKNPSFNYFKNKYPLFYDSIDLDEKALIIVGIGNNTVRYNIVNQKFFKQRFVTLIDKNSHVSRYTNIEMGTVIMPGAIVNVDVHIGKHCIINTGATIDHDCYIEDYVHISPNASLAGNVCVGEGSHIGIGASIIQGIKIGRWCTIGAGTVLIHDVPDGATVVGNPGRIIRI